MGKKHATAHKHIRNDDRPNGKAWKHGQSPAQRGITINPPRPKRKDVVRDAIKRIHGAA